MPTFTGTLRKLLLMPDASEVTFDKRGFHARRPDAQHRLEYTGRQFLAGLEYGLGSGNVAEAEWQLEGVERPFRGFAYEGAAMGLAIADALSPWRRSRVRALLDGPGAPHVYMVYVGAGWALARVPRPLWRSIALPDPLLRWLVLDGFGFHQAYFATRDHVTGQQPPRIRVPWPDPSGYAVRGVDQGVGRALWFVCGADVEYLAEVINSFDPGRRGDLWSGAGLAACYAGGVDEGDLAALGKLASPHRQELAQGAAFAAKARLLADLVVPHTVDAARVICGTSVEEAAAVTDDALIDLPPDGPLPAFEVWRQRIQAAFPGAGE